MKLRKQHIYCKTLAKEEKVTTCPFHIMKNPNTMMCTLTNSEIVCFYGTGKTVPENCPLRKGPVTLNYYLKGTEDD